MPDVHALCIDLEQALNEALLRFKLSSDVLRDGLGLGKEDYELAMRFTHNFYEEHNEFITSLVKSFGKPTLIEIWPERFFYFTLKWEFNFIDNLNKASALSTDQIDVENAQRYDITYIDDQGQRQFPIILHCSPSGAVERCIYALLEKAYAEQRKGNVPALPLWLSPTQVRLIPIKDEYLPLCEEIKAELEQNRIRTDIDDRSATVQRKIRDGEREWIPYILCIGEREVKSKIFPVRVRELRTIKNLGLVELITEINTITEQKPFKRLPLPPYLSKRPIFVG
jgi:threonyl-tRNA synthetase